MALENTYLLILPVEIRSLACYMVLCDGLLKSRWPDAALAFDCMHHRARPCCCWVCHWQIYHNRLHRKQFEEALFRYSNKQVKP